MNVTTTPPPTDDLDALMRSVARDLAMGIYELADILKNRNIEMQNFMRWSGHTRFIEYLRSEKEAWTSATNTPERTKLKAAIVIEEFMAQAHAELHDRKTPLNQRVELAKLLAKITGLGEPKNVGVGASGPAFQLQINIGPGVSESITVNANAIRPPDRQDIEAIYGPDDDGDEYDPFTSPDSLEE